jgi:hypothetical protein
MKARTLSWLVVLGVTSLGCSGRFDVGEMEGPGGGAGDRGAAGGAAPGGGGVVSTAGRPTAAPGGGGTSTASYIASDCLTASEPGPLAGPFAAPAVLWDRAARLSWGAAAPRPPSDLPATATYEWAGSLAVTEIVAAHTTIGDAPGVEDFVRQWLGLDAAAPLAGRWGQLLPVPQPVLNTLLLTSIGPYRTGVFTEPSWLTRYSTISARGTGIQNSLFGTAVPPPPPGLQNPPPDPNLPDRQALQVQTAEPICAGCHQLIDPVGYALGHFANDGSYRALDHGQPIDTTGSRYVSGMMATEFDGIADFGQKFAASCQATLGFSDAFLRAALVINDAPPAHRETLFEQSQMRVQQGFIAGGRTYLALVTAYLQSPAGLRP